jgi:methylphosphonate synthase
MQNKDSNYVKLLGQRILSEANDLKRTIPSLANEISVPIEKMDKIMKGEMTLSSTLEIIQKICSYYPVSLASILIDQKDYSNSVRIMREEESKISSRIFSRVNASKERTPYYEYRDTAMTTLSPFKPEWIKELRYVADSDPENPDIAYNNGHFLHQMTAFIGPVNFYWEVNGKKYCREMNTGDSNYITPFWKHSFATRSKTEEAIIIAVTFSGDVARARNELYSLGKEKIEPFILETKSSNKSLTQLILQLLDNHNLTRFSLIDLANRHELDLDVDTLLNQNKEKPLKDLTILSKLLHIPEHILSMPEYSEKDEVVVKDSQSNDGYYFSSDLNPDYFIKPLARNSRMPFMHGFNIKIVSEDEKSAGTLNTSLHSFIYNYGESEINFKWFDKEKWTEEVILPGDSMYLEPFTKHKFWDITKEGKIFNYRVAGSINLEVQKELSFFADKDRIIESEQWFN